MGISEYTSFDEVRAVLGVEDDELKDETLGLKTYDLELTEELREISPTLISLYSDIKGKEENDRSNEEGRVYELTRLFAVYYVAQQAGNALPMFSPRSIGDGKATMTRFSGEPYKEMLEKISGRVELYRTRLKTAIEELVAQTTVRNPRRTLVAVGSAYDPVTGE